MSRGRPKLAIGELGTVSVDLVGASWQARARTRTASGELVRIARRATTEEEARIALKAEAKRLGLHVAELDSQTTLSELLELWIPEKRRSGKVKERSMVQYERHCGYINELAGAVPLGELHPGRVQKLVDQIWDRRSLSAAHTCTTVLRGAFALAVRRGALSHTPMHVLEPLPASKGKGKSLTVAQVGALRGAMRRREDRIKERFGRETPNPRIVIEVLLASGLRISEALALSHRDVDLEAGTIGVANTLIVARGGAVVENTLKDDGQKRVIELPAFGVAALREARSNCLTVQSRLPDAPAIQSETGTNMLQCNFRRALRSLHSDEQFAEALAETGLAPADVTPHTIRRTVASLLAVHDGRARAAQELLGHANESTTARSYITGAYKRVSGAAPTLEELFGDPDE